MAFVVQGDVPIPGANAYIDVAFHRAYWFDRGIDLTATSDEDLQVDIVKATQYIDLRFEYVGDRVDRVQDLEWPRQFAYNDRGDYVTGLPTAVKQATSEYAYRARNSELLVDPVINDTGFTVKSKTETVGPLTESYEYDTISGYSLPNYPQADRILIARGLVRSGGTAIGAKGLTVGSIGRA